MPSTEHPSETRVAAFSYWYQGEPLADIGKKLGVDQSSIRRWMEDGKWKEKRERMHSESELYAVDSIVSNQNEAVGMFMERFPSILKRCLTDLDSDDNSWREKKDVMNVMTGMFNTCRLIFPDPNDQDLKRVSGSTSGPIQLASVSESS